MSKNSNTKNKTSQPYYLKSRLRLFLSIDLVGSTALKQSRMMSTKKIHHGIDWRDPFIEFYQQFQYQFAKQWRKAIQELKDLEIIKDKNDGNAHSPKLWKAAGDELIYCYLIEHSFQACWAVRAWIIAAKVFRKELRENYPALDVKMAAWVAGFPVINSEVVLKVSIPAEVKKEARKERLSNTIAILLSQLKEYYKTKNKDNNFLDFIGPSMDIGFRLCNFASQRRMPISLELLFILANVQKDLLNKRQRLSESEKKNDKDPIELFIPKIRYQGREKLKGVLDGRTYPVFWLDTALDDPIEKAEDNIVNRKSVSPDMCLNLCKAFIEEVDNPLLMWQPYLGETDDGILRTKAHSLHKEVIEGWLKDLEETLFNKDEIAKSEQKESEQKENDGKEEAPENIEL
ncbi:hypothetical protein ACQZV8_01865 [Magnetococcales bacterium HHB-1]